MTQEITFRELRNGKFKAQVCCSDCGKVKNIILTEEQFEGLQDWANNGTLIQDAVPDLPAETRELFVSGICPECWDAMFGDDDDDDDDDE